MIYDARSESTENSLTARVCIIGAGAAGIALARRLSKQVDDVLLVEAGDRLLEGATQRLYAGRNIGLNYFDLLTCRLRYYGGTTNHWSGYCRANDPIDYEGREQLGVPAWPLSHDDLEPFFAEAASDLGISSAFFEPSSILGSRGFPVDHLVEHDTKLLSTKVFQLTDRVRHGKIFEEELDAFPQLRRVFNLNIVEIVLDESGGRVDHVVARTTTGRTFELRSTVFILACHAIENARILLCSDKNITNGVGNKFDHVGRYFMEHPHIYASKIIPSEKFPDIYNRYILRQKNINSNVGLTEDAMREHGTLSYYCRFNPVYADERTENALIRLRDDFFEPFDSSLVDDVQDLLADLGGASNIALRQLGTNPTPRYYLLEHRIEQAPNAESRVVISTRRDAVGQFEADLDWRLSDLDIHGFAAGQEVVAREFSALGYGRFELEHIDRALVEARVEGHYHHMGTTRMSGRPEDGVVNPDCRVHGIDNLYVAGSSVFTTGGYSGPTMTIIALAIRLADHLVKRLG